MKPRLRIAILAHSTNPRGGVVHALELGDALCRLGHEATVHAPDASGAGLLPADALRDRERRGVAGRARRHRDGRDPRRRLPPAFRSRRAIGDFDVWHAQDGISGNALATLKERGLIRGFARTVHHVDSFADPRLAALQTRAIASADRLFAVSRLWRDWLAARVRPRSASRRQRRRHRAVFAGARRQRCRAARSPREAAGGRPRVSRDRRRRGAQEHGRHPRGVSHRPCEASVGVPRDRRRRLAARPRRLPGASSRPRWPQAACRTAP